MIKFQELHPEYEADWQGFDADLQCLPARVLIDLSAANIEPKLLPISACITISVAMYGREGEDTEVGRIVREQMIQFRDELGERCLACLVGIITFTESLDLQFYLAEQEGLEDELRTLLAKYLVPYNIPYTLNLEQDPIWNAYDSFYPDDWGVIQIENEARFSDLANQGDVLTAQRPVTFVGIFGSEEQASACLPALEDRGYHSIEIVEHIPSDEEDEEEQGYLLYCTKEMSLGNFPAFNREQIELYDLFSDYSGDIRGWTTMLVTVESQAQQGTEPQA